MPNGYDGRCTFCDSLCGTSHPEVPDHGTEGHVCGRQAAPQLALAPAGAASAGSGVKRQLGEKVVPRARSASVYGGCEETENDEPT
jgi:hypothetical protein